jgi:CRP-like cAMP-binding protein
MTSGQQRSNTSALSEKEATVNAVANGKDYAEFLGDIPAFSNCAMEVLEEFVAYGAFKVHHAAGKTLCFQTQCDQNLYVLVSGSATLDAGDGVQVSLQPGDYFGRNPRRYHELIASVIADEDVEVLVIRPQEVLLLEEVSSRHRHPSKIEWRSELATPAARLARRRHHVLVAS